MSVAPFLYTIAAMATLTTLWVVVMMGWARVFAKTGEDLLACRGGCGACRGRCEGSGENLKEVHRE